MRPRIIPRINPMSEVDAQENRDANVSSQEAAGAPIRWPEDVEAIDQRKNREKNDGEV